MAFSQFKCIELFCPKDWPDSVDLSILNPWEQINPLKEKVKTILEKTPRIFALFVHDDFIKKFFLV